MSSDGKPRNTDQPVDAKAWEQAPYWKELERRKRLAEAEKARKVKQ